MSNISLLRRLAGDTNGSFSKLIASMVREPRVAWYPSAGEDLRDLLHLCPSFSEIRPAQISEPEPPDIFIHSDYFPWSDSRFLDSNVIFSDGRTKMIVSSIEELPRLDLPLDPQIVVPNGSHQTGRVVFLQIKVESNLLGSYSFPLVYVFAENAAFCANIVLVCSGKFSHIIHVRYGGGCGGGGKSNGSWLLNILPSLGCEVFITDGHHEFRDGDNYVLEAFPIIAQSTRQSRLERIREIDEHSWSEHGNVSWNLVRST